MPLLFSSMDMYHQSLKNKEAGFSVAPMMDWTDRHCRFFHRLLSPTALLYTEMVTTGALLYGDARRWLRFDPSEHPVAIQLGGSDPHDLARCAALAAAEGYDQINLNVGCPSDRVQSGRFGACLMKTPALVADCVAAMRAAVSIPVTVKHRIGVDDQDSYAQLHHFVETVAAAGCEVFIVHARAAWLQGLSPKQNRDIPPLRYDDAAQLVSDFPQLTVVVNGGIDSVAAVDAHLRRFHGVMIGRAAYRNPYLLAELERALHPAAKVRSRDDAVRAMLPYVARQLADGSSLRALIRPLLGLFQGQWGARRWRRRLTEAAAMTGGGAAAIEQALGVVHEHCDINDRRSQDIAAPGAH